MVKDTKDNLKEMKCQFTGHNNRKIDDSLNKQIMYWRLWEYRRRRGKPQKKWSDLNQKV